MSQFNSKRLLELFNSGRRDSEDSFPVGRLFEKRIVMERDGETVPVAGQSAGATVDSTRVDKGTAKNNVMRDFWLVKDIGLNCLDSTAERKFRQNNIIQIDKTSSIKGTGGSVKIHSRIVMNDDAGREFGFLDDDMRASMIQKRGENEVAFLVVDLFADGKSDRQEILDSLGSREDNRIGVTRSRSGSFQFILDRFVE